MSTPASHAATPDETPRSEPLPEAESWASPAEEADHLRRRLLATPRDETLYNRLAAACFKMKNPWEAEFCFRRITEINSGNIAAWNSFARMNGGEEKTVQEATARRAAFAKAIGLHEAGQFAEASAAYLDVLAGRFSHSAGWNAQILDLDQAADPPDPPRISIYVCCHKTGPAPQDEVLKPIHVGAALAAAAIGHPGDDTGTNISTKNPSYCELTGHYWAWKNDRDADYIGLAHYRRLFWFSHIQDPSVSRYQRKAIPVSAPFQSVTRPAIARRLITSCDVVVPMPWPLGVPLEKQFIATAPKGHQPDYALLWQLTAEAARRHHAEIYAGGIASLATGNGYFYNMMVMKRPYFEEYSAFLFDVLERVEQCATQLGISIFNTRVAGFLAERLMTLYIGYLRGRQAAQIREVPVAHFV